MDAINAFVDNLIKTKYEDLPESAIESAKKEVLDSLATALGGTTRDGIKGLVDLVKEWGGREQSTVIGYNLKCPAPDAALVNGTMIHALDYDDGHQTAQVHIGCTAVSSCFAVAERQGKVSGKELIATLALGGDFMSRLGMASRPHGVLVKSGWHPTPLYGYLGAAAIAARLIKLDKEKTLNALGIAYHQCSGNSQAVEDGALTKRLGPGLAARGGVTAALMAERGLTGAHNILEGRFGVFNQYHAGDYSPEILLDELGQRYESANIGSKPYPNCGFSHAFIDAVLNLKAKYNIATDQIADITATAGDSSFELCNPIEVKRTPRNPVDSQFSLPWAIAVAMVKGKVTLDDFTPEAITRKEILEVSQKVTGKLDKSFSRHGVGPGRVTINLKDGTQYSEYVEHCLGSVERPMTFTDCARKFRECAAVALKPLPASLVDETIEKVEQMENLDDATQIIRLVG